MKTGAATILFQNTKFNSKLWETVKYVTALTHWQDTLACYCNILYAISSKYTPFEAYCTNFGQSLVTSILAYIATVAVKNKFPYS